jgi:4-hydroxybenzoate polyprenyltransferase
MNILFEHTMIKRATLIHLRIPFSLYLLPFFSFAASQSNHPNWWYLILSCIIIHPFFYPSANAFNSYFDKDEGSIGGIEFPPPVDKELLYTSYIFEFIALTLALLISWQFTAMLFIINLIFKAYSHPWVRLKKISFSRFANRGFISGSAYLFNVLYGHQ